MNMMLPAALNIAAFLLGQWLVTRGRWTGFLLWAASNLMIATCCFLQRGPDPTGGLFVVYATVNVASMLAWRQGRRGDPAARGGSPGRRP